MSRSVLNSGNYRLATATCSIALVTLIALDENNSDEDTFRYISKPLPMKFFPNEYNQQNCIF